MTLSAWQIALAALAANLLVSSMVWLFSAVRRNVGLVDRVWSLLIMLSASIFVFAMAPLSSQSWAMMMVGSLWAVRLCFYITRRSWGQPEDPRYTDIRRRNEPHFVWKSLYLVFDVQAVLAWLIATPFLAVAMSPPNTDDWSWLDGLALSISVVGLLFEAVADAQMAAFKAKCPTPGSVMQTGLWRYSRHPNYFGESCVWWGMGLFAVSAGAWWALLSPILITYLLLKVSGINLQEKESTSRSAEYANYLRITPAFIPWPPKQSKSSTG
jgi:steroid 5-alpha reductase family enzyme